MFRRLHSLRWPGRPAWVLWLALLLPLAQLGAAAHAYGHLQDPVRTSGDKHLPAACDVCLVAAAIGGGGAPASAPPSLPLATLEHAAPEHIPAGHAPLAAPAPYLSRAPPALHA
jgi:hypothetical protein